MWHDYMQGRRQQKNLPSQSAVALVVQAPAELVYDQWNRFEDLPHFMKEPGESEKLSEARMVWRIEFHGRHVPWEAEIIQQIPGRCISWLNLEGRPCPHSGSVHFQHLSESATRIKVEMEFEPAESSGQFADPLRSVTILVERSLQRFAKFLQLADAPDSFRASGCRAS